MRRIWVVSAAFALVASIAVAQPRVPKAPPKPADAPAVGSATIAKLGSGDVAEIRAALDEARMAGKAGAKAAPAIAELLSRGMPIHLTQAAIETLADLEDESASATLALYARHRNVLVRDNAVRALAHTKGHDAVRALRLALSDSDAAVRQDAVQGLLALKAKEAVGDLFIALEHRVPKTAAAIGEICVGSDCERFVSLSTGLPFSTIATGLQRVLLRPSQEVSDDTKVRILDKLREVQTSEVHGFLADLLRGWPRDGTQSQRVRESLERAVKTTGGG